MSEWISVKDRLPADERKVLVSSLGLIGYTYRDLDTDCWAANVYESDFVYKFYIDLNDPYCEYNIECTSDQITHWMPLPKPPEES